MEERFVYQVSSKEIPVSIGGKKFDLKVYDCIRQEFHDVLTIETKGRTVMVRTGEWIEDILIND